MNWVALGLWWTVVVAYFLVAPGSTDRRLLRAGPLRATARSWRAYQQRVAAGLASWPYTVLRTLGLGRQPAPGRPHDEPWTMGPVRLVRYPGDGSRPPVLLVHSFISRPSILDLAPGRSVIGALTEAGHDVHLLDWGVPGRNQARTGFEGYVATVQLAIDAVVGRTGPVLVVGYCMGAALAMAADADRPGRVAGIVALAPPGDLSAAGGLHRQLRRTAFRPAWVLDGDGLVPGAVIRESFHILRPDAIRGGWRAWRAARRDPAYRPVADGRARWAYDQTPIPGGLLFDLVDMVRGNSLMRRIESSTAPRFVVIADRDHIVPPESSLALAGGPRSDLLRVPSGHVAMLSGAESADTLYPAMLGWLEQAAEASTTVSA